MERNQRPFWGRVVMGLRTQFVAGIITVVPIAATILILIWVFATIDNILQPIIQLIFGHTIRGVGFGITILLIYLVGVIASNVIGKRVIRYVESALPWIPLFRQLYNPIRQIMESFSTAGKTGFLRVVLVEFPRKGMKAVGFVTGESNDRSGKKLLNVFIPTSPTPTGGFLQIMGEEETIHTNISIEDALKMVVSAGSLSPKEINGESNQNDQTINTKAD